MDVRGLGAVRVAGGAVDAAGRHVDEALDAGLPGEGGQADAAVVVDLERDVRVELADRIVRQLGKVDDRVEAAQVLHGDVPDVLGHPGRRAVHAVVQPADAVEAGVEAGDVVAAVEQIGAQDRADIALAAGDQDSHQFHTFHGA